MHARRCSVAPCPDYTPTAPAPDRTGPGRQAPARGRPRSTRSGPYGAGWTVSTDRPQRRAARARRHGAHPVREHLARIGWVCQQAVQRCGAPGSVSLGRGNTELLQALPEAKERGVVVAIPGEEVPHDRRLGLVQPHTRRVAWAVGIKPIAIGRLRPGQQCAGAQLAQTAPAHALVDQGSLVFGHGPADLEEKLIVRVLA